MKQKTLEEAANRLFYTVGNEGISSKESFIEGAKWQAKRMYNKKDMIKLIQFIVSQESLENTSSVSETTAKFYLKLFENKHYGT